jgi:type VI secretion system protein VasJ
MQQGGLAGLAEGVVALREVSNQFWDNMYPPARRARARGNQAEWLMEQVAQYLGQLQPKASDRAPFEAVETSLNDLDQLLAEKLGDAYSGMGGARGMLREKSRQIPAEAAPQATPAAAPAAAPERPAAAPAAAASEIPAISSAEDAVRALRAVSSAIVDAATAMRQAEPSQAWPYRLLRIGIWLTVDAAPPAEGNSTRIPPPDEDDRKRLEAMASGEQWMALLNAAEELTSTYLFWFDLHRFVALAMDRLGALFIEARKALGQEVMTFVGRFPNITSLQFSDGTPFADAGTQSWLEEEAQKHGGGGGGGNQRVDEEEAELLKRFEEAKALVGGGKVADGLALAAQLAKRGADARARFRAKLQVARLAIQGGKPDLARPLLEGLAVEGDRHSLDEWEPSLSASLYASLLAVMPDESQGDEDGRPAESRAGGLSREVVFSRLCRLDPAAALKLSGR